MVTRNLWVKPGVDVGKLGSMRASDEGWKEVLTDVCTVKSLWSGDVRQPANSRDAPWVEFAFRAQSPSNFVVPDDLPEEIKLMECVTSRPDSSKMWDPGKAPGEERTSKAALSKEEWNTLMNKATKQKRDLS